MIGTIRKNNKGYFLETEYENFALIDKRERKNFKEGENWVIKKKKEIYDKRGNLIPIYKLIRKNFTNKNLYLKDDTYFCYRYHCGSNVKEKLIKVLSKSLNSVNFYSDYFSVVVNYSTKKISLQKVFKFYYDFMKNLKNWLKEKNINFDENYVDQKIIESKNIKEKLEHEREKEWYEYTKRLELQEEFLNNINCLIVKKVFMKEKIEFLGWESDYRLSATSKAFYEEHDEAVINKTVEYLGAITEVVTNKELNDERFIKLNYKLYILKDEYKKLINEFQDVDEKIIKNKIIDNLTYKVKVEDSIGNFFYWRRLPMSFDIRKLEKIIGKRNVLLATENELRNIE